MALKTSQKQSAGRILFRGFDKLYTLAGVARKDGRGIQPDDLGEIQDAALVARSGKVEWVGRFVDLPKRYRVKNAIQNEVHFRGRQALPAFVECHTHSLFAGNRADEFERRLRGESYLAIAKSGGGIQSTVRATREASAASLSLALKSRLQNFVRQGVTAVEVKSGYGLNAECEMKMLTVLSDLGRSYKACQIVPTFLGAHALSSDWKNENEYLDYLQHDVLPLIARKKLARRVDIFVEQGAFTRARGGEYLAYAKKLGFDLTIHADQITRSGGAVLALELGAISADHLIQIDRADIERLAHSQVTCVLLPTADLYLACPYPPARALIDRGARVALATDFNPGTAPSQDLALVGVLARMEMKMTLAETIAAYTYNSAKALGLERARGSLEIGKTCDFAVLEGAIDGLFYSVGAMPIHKVYAAGLRV